jgi:hypothetical protein
MPITGTFYADFSPFSSATKKAKDDLDDFNGATQKTVVSIGNVEQATKDVIGTVSKVAGAFGIGFSISAITAFIAETNQAAVALQNLGIQTGIGVEDLQVLQAATKDAGVDQGQLANAIFQLRERIAGGDAGIVGAYASMGLSLDQVKMKGNDALELFLMTERGLAGLSGEIQATAAKDLFGGRLGNSMITFAANADEAVAKARSFTTVAGTDAVRAAADMANEVDRATTSLKAYVMEWEGKASRIWNILNKNTELAKEGNQVDRDTIAGKTAIFDQIQKNAKANTEIVGGLVLEIGLTKEGTAARAESEGKTKDQISAESFLNTMRLNSAKPLLDWQKQGLDQLKDWGILTAGNAEKLKVNVAQLQAYQAQLERNKQTEADIAEQNRAFDSELQTQLASQIAQQRALEAARAEHFGLDAQIQMLRDLAAQENVHALAVADEITSEKERMKVIEANNKRQTELALQINALEAQLAQQKIKSNLEAINAQTQINAIYGRDAAGAIQLPIDAMEVYRRKIAELNATLPEGLELTNKLALANEELSQSLLKEAQATDAAAAAGAKANATKTEAIALTAQQTAAARAASGFSLAGGGGPESFSGLTGFKSANELANAAAGIFQVGMSGQELLSRLAASGAGRAAGGPVLAGASYVVGERGPELFSPAVSGSISPSGPSGAGGIQIVINGSVLSTAAELAARVEAAVISAYRRGGNRLPV